MDLYFGFGPVIRIRRLKPHRERFTFRPKIETLSEARQRWEMALDLLERRLAKLNLGEDTKLIEKEIGRLGFAWEDVPEDTAGKRNYSYWRTR